MAFAVLVPVCFLCLMILSVNADKPMNKLTICGGALNQSYEIHDTSCHRGLWMPDPVPADCICVTGTWLLMENYCDSNFYIISGPPYRESSGAGTQYSCFQFATKFRRFISLSSETTSYSQYIIQSNGKFIESIERENLPYSPSPETPIVIIRLNARNEMYMAHKAGVHSDIFQKCLGLRKRNPYNHIIKSEEVISSLKCTSDDETCDDLKDPLFPYTKSNSTEWIIVKVGSFAWGVNEGMIPVSNCSCSSAPHISSTIVTPSPSQPGEPKRSLYNTDPDYDSAPGDAFSLYPKKKDPLLHAEHLKDNAQTTASILTKFKNFLFFGTKPPPFPNPLFDYIRLGRKIVGNYCPEIPVAVVKSLVGLFRLLLTHDITKHPEEYSLNFDFGIHQSVLESLKKCQDGVAKTPVKFSWENVGAMKNSKYCVRGKVNKRKITSAEVNGTTIPISTANFPHDVKLIVDGDIVLEVVWKILLVTHYACTQYFEESPENLSFMYVKVQEFLTIPNVMFRWENPAYALTAAYKILITSLDAHELGQQLDACLYAAFKTSSFNTWLERPESASEFIPNSVVQRALDKITGNEPTTSQGESVFQKNFFTILGNDGLCVQEFNDPIIMSSADDHMAETIGITGC